MISQGFDESIKLVYFPHRDYFILIILSFIILISVGLCAVYLIRNQKLTNRIKLILLSISFIFGGIILGGVPNVVLLFQHIFVLVYLLLQTQKHRYLGLSLNYLFPASCKKLLIALHFFVLSLVFLLRSQCVQNRAHVLMQCT